MAQEAQGVLIIACGALAHDIAALRRANQWLQMDVTCLPAIWHNRPEKIPEGVRRKIRAGRKTHEHILVAYGDCGTGGELDRVLEQEGIERIPGAHCYEFLATSAVFEQLTEAEIGTFYLTDFLLRHFERLVMRGLGLDRHPELLPTYFGNYRKLVYLSQTRTTDADDRARAIAARLGLSYEFCWTGHGTLGSSLAAAMQRHQGTRREGAAAWAQ